MSQWANESMSESIPRRLTGRKARAYSGGRNDRSQLSLLLLLRPALRAEGRLGDGLSRNRLGFADKFPNRPPVLPSEGSVAGSVLECAGLTALSADERLHEATQMRRQAAALQEWCVCRQTQQLPRTKYFSITSICDRLPAISTRQSSTVIRSCNSIPIIPASAMPNTAAAATKLRKLR